MPSQNSHQRCHRKLPNAENVTTFVERSGTKHQKTLTTIWYINSKKNCMKTAEPYEWARMGFVRDRAPRCDRVIGSVGTDPKGRRTHSPRFYPRANRCGTEPHAEIIVEGHIGYAELAWFVGCILTSATNSPHSFPRCYGGGKSPMLMLRPECWNDIPGEGRERNCYRIPTRSRGVRLQTK